MNDLSTLLLAWYQENKRELPWREDQDPYHVWISEIMLQQTRIEAVIPYYDRFMKKIPSIHHLAVIPEDELLKLWEGLGYYNRARNLKKAAQMIVEKYHGVFPNRYDDILKLPGIGEYTASAIASICFSLATPTVDGNVMRVFTRLKEDSRNVDLTRTKKQIREELVPLMPKEAGSFNEAMMELGELICIPNGDAKCDICPLKSICRASKHQSWQNYPVRSEKKKQKELFYTVFLFSYQGRFAICKRKEEQLLKNMWQFPNILGKMTLKEVKLYLEKEQINYQSIHKSISHTHVFTHQIWHMQAYFITLNELIHGYHFETGENMKEKYAIPTAFQPFLRELLNILIVENTKK